MIDVSCKHSVPVSNRIHKTTVGMRSLFLWTIIMDSRNISACAQRKSPIKHVIKLPSFPAPGSGYNPNRSYAICDTKAVGTQIIYTQAPAINGNSIWIKTITVRMNQNLFHILFLLQKTICHPLPSYLHFVHKKCPQRGFPSVSIVSFFSVFLVG